MTESNAGAGPTGAAERDKPAVPPMRDGTAEELAMPGESGVLEPAAGVVVPEIVEPGVVEPETPVMQLKRTRISGLWVGVTVAALVLLLLLVFIVQNNSYVTIYFFGWGGSFPLGVALLLAAICGVLLVAIPGYGRIIQLRRSFRKAARRG